MESFTVKAIKIIKCIPEGKVMTYGQIATLAGSPKGARQVVRILHSMSKKYNLPWHRVINAKGEISIQDEELFINQKMMLENEGVKFLGERTINLKLYMYVIE
ncbi:DNA methyltransferase [Lottiidibacillus patelloidae]|uniref:DNA methyltransferase n=1 Tax=Lottiidibacillus patelloidae TaxID=2670334 RepID=A0A263BY48_9BACI|nr:MGMT family protein [Lottiidibacillus patelloidae]OZM58086.1 DNA methyltransferase [Lottiidibacillus patelloidae]